MHSTDDENIGGLIMSLTFSLTRNIPNSDNIYVEGECLSTDNKPTQGIQNGSHIKELDTSKLYFFDEENQTWREWE